MAVASGTRQFEEAVGLLYEIYVVFKVREVVESGLLMAAVLGGSDRQGSHSSHERIGIVVAICIGHELTMHIRSRRKCLFFGWFRSVDEFSICRA